MICPVDVTCDLSGFILSPKGGALNRAEVLQEVRLMKFEEVYTRRTAGKLTQEQAAEMTLVFR